MDAPETDTPYRNNTSVAVGSPSIDELPMSEAIDGSETTRTSGFEHRIGATYADILVSFNLAPDRPYITACTRCESVHGFDSENGHTERARDGQADCPCGGSYELIRDGTEPEIMTDGGEPEQTGIEKQRDNEPGGDITERSVEHIDSGVRIKTKIQRGTGTNDRDTVTGEVRRQSLGEAAEELEGLEMVLRGHLREIRGWDENGESDGTDGGESFIDSETAERLRDAGEQAGSGMIHVLIPEDREEAREKYRTDKRFHAVVDAFAEANYMEPGDVLANGEQSIGVNRSEVEDQ